jgi:hypothetical protein
MKGAGVQGCRGARVLGARVLGARVRGALLVMFMWCPALAGLAFAQHEGHQPAPQRSTAKPEPTPQPAKVLGWEPIRCWRQASAGAIAIGETFTVVLTCAVYEGDNAQVIPDESRLGVASIQLAPFEILGGAHPPDVRRGSRRFFQYDYQLRILSRDAIGHDINLPPLPISYRIHSRVGAAATLEGRDLSYVMPMMPIKVLSLVPADAADIRDASEASLGAVDALRFRSSLFRVLTLAFAALATVMAVLALMPLARSGSAAAEDQRGRIPDRAIVDRAAEDLRALQARRGAEGWSDETVARALGSMRLIGAAAIDQAISQKPLRADGVVPEGRLLVRHGVLRKTLATVSSAATADDMARAHSRDGSSTTRQQQLEGLRSGLLALTTALYRREPVRDPSALDEAVRHAISVAADVAKERSRWTLLRQGSRLRRGSGGQVGGQG